MITTGSAPPVLRPEHQTSAEKEKIQMQKNEENGTSNHEEPPEQDAQREQEDSQHGRKVLVHPQAARRLRPEPGQQDPVGRNTGKRHRRRRGMNKKPRPVHTIGHSDMGREKLIDRLEQYEIQLVVDVRSAPHSRHAPQFNREELAGALGQRGIGYIHMGDELGGRPTEDRLYDEQGRAQYGLMALESKFQEGVRQLAQTAMERRLTLLCTERDPLKCHRTLLVAPALEQAGVPVVHITGDGKGVSHKELMGRLLTMQGLPRRDGMGLTRQARQAAYRKR